MPGAAAARAGPGAGALMGAGAPPGTWAAWAGAGAAADTEPAGPAAGVATGGAGAEGMPVGYPPTERSLGG